MSVETPPPATCGGYASITGSPSVNQLLRVWRKRFVDSTPCFEAPTIAIDDSSSSTGAARVCGVRRGEDPVDVAAMLRPMNQLEASTNNGWSYNCTLSTRRTIEVSLFLFRLFGCHSFRSARVSSGRCWFVGVGAGDWDKRYCSRMYCKAGRVDVGSPAVDI